MLLQVCIKAEKEYVKQINEFYDWFKEVIISICERLRRLLFVNLSVSGHFPEK